ncbi:hypothetical protein [Ruminiclostridium josui]|uniref:hypothetical protein n=1 Tax=Ruminiclostridium josui TaxID=1499 RepID=UPI0004BA892C|nr:hypothetical protein [Ruminiclostridium josui]
MGIISEQSVTKKVDQYKTTLQTYSHLYPNKHGEVADKLQKLVSDETVETTEK